MDSGIENFSYTIGEPTYSITYHLDGGVNHPDNPVSYASSAGVPDLKAPTKTGYRFMGWTDSTGNPITGILAGTAGNIDLTAAWG